MAIDFFTPDEEAKFQQNFNEKFKVQNYKSDACLKAQLKALLIRYCRQHREALFSDQKIEGKLTDFLHVRRFGFQEKYDDENDRMAFFERHLNLTPDRFNVMKKVKSETLLANEAKFVEVCEALSDGDCQLFDEYQYKYGHKSFAELCDLSEADARIYIDSLARKKFEEDCRPLFANKHLLGARRDRLYAVMTLYCNHHEFQRADNKYGAACGLGNFLGIYDRYFYEQCENYSVPSEDFEQRLQFIQDNLNLKPFQFKLIKREPLNELLENPGLVQNYGTLTWDDYLLVTEYSRNPRDLFHEKRDDRSNEAKYLLEKVPLRCSSH